MKTMTHIGKAASRHWMTMVTVTLGFMILYYAMLLLATMIRFAEIPNYFVFHDLVKSYGLVFSGTPSWTDAFFILLDEPWFETGYKNPDYYGIATWSYMLIPPKMLIIGLVGLLLALFLAVNAYAKKHCRLKTKGMLLTAGAGSALVGITGATLTWVVCCATPSWVVALAMLGMSSSLALLLEPLGTWIAVTGIVLLLFAVYRRAKTIDTPSLSKAGIQPGVSPMTMKEA